MRMEDPGGRPNISPGHKKLTLFLSFYIQSSFDFVVKRQRNRIQLESEERKECFYQPSTEREATEL